MLYIRATYEGSWEVGLVGCEDRGEECSLLLSEFMIWEVYSWMPPLRILIRWEKQRISLMFSKITFPCSSQRGELMIKISNQNLTLYNPNQSAKIEVKTLGVNIHYINP